MTPNEQMITTFYSAFQQKKYKVMQIAPSLRMKCLLTSMHQK